MAVRAGFIGLGNLGKPLALHLVPAGFDTIVYDIAEEPVRELVAAGAKQAHTPREVAENADLIGICVPQDEHVRGLMAGDDGLLAGSSAGAVVAIHSTVLPSTVLEMAALARPHGVAVLDACVTGGDQRAAEGMVTYLVGGDEAALEKIRAFLDASSEKVIHAGSVGDGAKLKLCINVLTYLQFAAANEALSLALASGLPAEVFEEAGRSNGQLTELTLRYLTSVKLPGAVKSTEGYQNLVRKHMRTAEKDLAWALQLARESELNLPVSGLVSQLMARIYGVEDDLRR